LEQKDYDKKEKNPKKTRSQKKDFWLFEDTVKREREGLRERTGQRNVWPKTSMRWGNKRTPTRKYIFKRRENARFSGGGMKGRKLDRNESRPRKRKTAKVEAKDKS